MRMPPCLLYVEPFAGAFACGLQLLQPGLQPPCAWMGSKRRLARILLALLGLRPGQGAESILLADPGPWGWVWPALLTPPIAAEVMRQLRDVEGYLQDEGLSGRDLWEALAAWPPPADLATATAGWLWMQGLSLAAVPIFWREGRWLICRGGEKHSFKPAAPRSEQRPEWGGGGNGLTLPGLAGRVDEIASAAAGWLALQSRAAGAIPVVIQDGRWVMSDRTRSYYRAGQSQNASVQPGTLAARVEVVATAAAQWLWLLARAERGKPPLFEGGRWLMPRSAASGEGLDGLHQAGQGGVLRPGTVAGRLEELSAAPFQGAAVYHGPAEDLYPTGDHTGTCVLIDGPYKKATGYGFDCPRERQVEVARRWSDAGAAVVVCEAEGLARELGGDFLDLDLSPLPEAGKGPEWVTSNRPFPAAVLDRVERARGRLRGQQLNLLEVA